MKVARFRRVPAPLLVALAGAIAWAGYDLVDRLTGYVVADEAAYSAVTWGSSLAIHVLMAVGLAALARKLQGTARIGARIATIATVAWIALHVLRMATEIWWNAARSRMGDPVVRTVDIAIVVASVATMAGLGLAARRWYWTAIAIVVAVPEHLRSLVGWRRFQDLSQGQFHVVFIATGVVVLVSALVAATLVFVACRDVEPDDALVASGSSLRRIRLALYAMAVAPTLLVVCTVLLGNPTWTWPAHVAAMTLELLGLVVLALALLGTAELPRWLAIASAAIALCVAGHTLFSMASVVGAATIDWELIRLPDKLKPDLPSQLLASCAVGGVLVAIALAARRRGLDALRGRAMAMTVMFAALVLGALTAQHLVGNTSELTQLGAGLVLCASAAVIASYLVAAAVVRRGEHALASQASLPAAKLITC